MEAVQPEGLDLGADEAVSGRESDAQRIAALFERNVERARRLAFRLIGGDEAAAEDIVQDAFVKAQHGLRRFREESSLDTWFYRIVVREAANHRRWRRVREILSPLGGEEPPDPRPRGPGDPVLRRSIAAALDRLSPAQRDVFTLVHLEEFTVRQTAEILNRSEGTVKTHLHRALVALRRDLAPLRGDGAPESP